jgi:hypothetical protein
MRDDATLSIADLDVKERHVIIGNHERVDALIWLDGHAHRSGGPRINRDCDPLDLRPRPAESGLPRAHVIVETRPGLGRSWPSPRSTVRSDSASELKGSLSWDDLRGQSDEPVSARGACGQVNAVRVRRTEEHGRSRIRSFVDGDRIALVGEGGDVEILDRRRSTGIPEQARVGWNVDECAESLTLDHLPGRDQRDWSRAEPLRATRELTQKNSRVELPRNDVWSGESRARLGRSDFLPHARAGRRGER